MKIERLNPGELLSAIAGLALLGLMSAVWFEHPYVVDIEVDAIGFHTEPNAWQAFGFIDVVLFITVVCAISAAVVSAAGSRIPLPLSAAAAVTVFGLLSLLLLGYRIIDPIEIAGVTYRRNLPLFLGFGMCGLIVLGGVMTMIAEGTGLRRELSRAARRGDSEASPADRGDRASRRSQRRPLRRTR